MTKSTLIDAVLHEMERIWGDGGLGGEPEEYEWLLKTYNISEEEDVQWQLILQDDMNDLPEEDREDEELMIFLNNENAVEQFLRELISKYKSSTSIYPPRV